MAEILEKWIGGFIGYGDSLQPVVRRVWIRETTKQWRVEKQDKLTPEQAEDNLQATYVSFLRWHTLFDRGDKRFHDTPLDAYLFFCQEQVQVVAKAKKTYDRQLELLDLLNKQANELSQTKLQ